MVGARKSSKKRCISENVRWILLGRYRLTLNALCAVLLRHGAVAILRYQCDEPNVHFSALLPHAILTPSCQHADVAIISRFRSRGVSFRYNTKTSVHAELRSSCVVRTKSLFILALYRGPFDETSACSSHSSIHHWFHVGPVRLNV
jgi:hypothetical protein